MRFALLGATPETIALVRRLRLLGHSFVAAYDVGPDASAIREAAPGAAVGDDWESLLFSKETDAVLVAGPLPAVEIDAELRLRREDQLRKLFQAAVPMLIVPPIVEGIVGFELEMIRRDVRGNVVPYLPESRHPRWMKIVVALERRREQDGSSVESIQFDRYLPTRSRSQVLTAFSRDAEAIRRLIGPLRRITAAGGGGREGERPQLAGVSVSIEGASSPPSVRWSVHPAGEFEGLRVTLVGDTAASTERWEFPAEEASDDVLREILQPLQADVTERRDDGPTWLDACRGVEAAEAVDRSLERRRTIELYNEEHSEEASFRGIMAATGCILLLVGLGLYFAVGLFAAVVPVQKIAPGQWKWFQVCLFVPFAVFLLLQLLSFGLRAHHRKKAQRNKEDTAEKQG